MGAGLSTQTNEGEYMTTRTKKEYISERNFDSHNGQSEVDSGEGADVLVVNGIKCQFNMPEAVKSEFLKNEDGEFVLDGDGKKIEKKRGLPPYRQRRAFVVDKYPACPSNWMNGSALASSYFVPIKPEHGMWLDFNANSNFTHEVAVVISVQGVNPLTGRKQNKLCLEKYTTKCPRHKVEFKQDRFCPKCKFEWPAQNYLASTGTPPGEFWLDGFRAPDGKVRQYVFTEQESRGVAKAILGNDRVFAIGLAFYLSKEAKPALPPMPMRSYSSFGFSGEELGGASKLLSMDDGENTSGGGLIGLEATASSALQKGLPVSTTHAPKGPGGQTASRGHSLRSRHRLHSKAVKAKTYEVAAGASINQDIHADPKELDFWEPEPVGMIYLSYCDERAADEILDSGMREEVREGFLDGIPVGN